MGKESVTKKDTSNKKHMLGGTCIQFPLERGRGSHKERGNKVETFLQLYYLSSYTVTFVWLF